MLSKNSDIIKTISQTFLARGISATGNVLLFITIGQLYGVNGIAIFALSQSIILAAGIMTKWGMDNTLLLLISSNNQDKKTLIYLIWAIKKALILSISAAVLIFIFKDIIEEIFKIPGLRNVLIGISLATPAFTLGFILAGFFKGLKKPATASLLENGAIGLLTSLILVLWYKADSSPSAIGYSYAVASWIILAQGFIKLILWKKENSQANLEKFVIVKKSEFNEISFSFFIMSLASFFQLVVSMLIVGLLLEPVDIGHYKVSQQSASLISFVLIVVNAIYPPIFSKLHKDKNFRELSNKAKQSTLIALLIGLPVFSLIFISPNFVLSLFGEGLESANTMLRIIAIGQLINIMTGPVVYLLVMTGHELLMKKVTLYTSIIGIIIFTFLTFSFGANGAAIGFSLIIIGQNLISVFFAWKRLGIWSLPCPNFLSIIGIKRQINH